MSGLLFGTAGVPLTSRTFTTPGGIERIAELGLGCMEVEFVQGVRMRPEGAAVVAKMAREKHIRLTCHAPYFVNLNTREPLKLAASRQRLLHTARIASQCGAESVAFHAGFYSGTSPESAYQTVKAQLATIMEQLKTDGNSMCMRPEVSGKPSQFGTLDEVLNLSAEVPGVAPCIDFAHLHSWGGAVNSFIEFNEVLQRMQAKLGREALQNMHIHVSGIEYGKHGERRHLNLNESDLDYKALLTVLKEQSVRGFVICESPNLEEDALLLQETYSAL